MEKTKNTTKTQSPLSEGANKALALLKENKEGLTVADMKKLGFTNANSSHLVALKRRGLVDSVETEIEVQVVQKRKVQKYFIVKND